MLKIEEMFAFVSTDEQGEGVIGTEMMIEGRYLFAPLVGTDMDRVDSLRPIADRISRQTGKPYKILRFKLVGEIQ